MAADLLQGDARSWPRFVAESGIRLADALLQGGVLQPERRQLLQA
jgi:hypothetical protein